MDPKLSKAYQLREVAKEISDKLKMLSGDIQKSGSIPETIVDHMKTEGLFRILQPALFGGYELDPFTFFKVQRELSKSCMSAGWLMGVLGLQAWQVGLFSPEAQRDVWQQESNAIICSSFMPAGHIRPIKDGFILSGHWKYSSGCRYSAWALLGGLVHEEGKLQDYRAFLVPRNDYAISEDWNVVGLQATESYSLTVEEAYVPAYRTFRAIDGLKCICPGHDLHTNAIYRIPFGQLFGLCIALPAVGALEGVIGYTLAHAEENKHLESSSNPSSMQMALANTTATVYECDSIIKSNLHFLLSHANRSSIPSIEDRVRMRFDSVRVSQKCVQSINDIFIANGTSSIQSSNRYSQLWLDINAAHLHAANSPARFGKLLSEALLGQEVMDPLI